MNSHEFAISLSIGSQELAPQVDKIIEVCQERDVSPIVVLAGHCKLDPHGSSMAKQTAEQYKYNGIVVPSLAESGTFSMAYLQGWQIGANLAANVISLDADGSHDPYQILDFIDALRQGNKAVMGSRRVEGSVNNYPLRRRLISQIGTLFANAILNPSDFQLTDFTSGFEGINSQTIQALFKNYPPINWISSTHGPYHLQNTELRMNLLSSGVPIHKIPITYGTGRIGKNLELEYLFQAFYGFTLLVRNRKKLRVVTYIRFYYSKGTIMQKDSRIYIAGHNGLVGVAIKRYLEKDGYTNLLCRSHAELDLTDDLAVQHFFESEKPEYVFLFAAKVGGIISNRDHPVEFLYENLKIELNVIGSAHKFAVKKLMMPGSTCIYPKLAEQPLKEESLLAGPLEPTNEAYAIAKIAGIKLCQSFNMQYGTNFISVMPTSIYGPNDNFDPAESHVIPALIRRFHDAKINKLESVVMWGTGTPRREFMHVDDMADALVYLMNNYDGSELINIGMGDDLPINDLAIAISKVIGYEGKIEHDLTKPDGTPRKLVDTSKLDKTGWKAKIKLDDGLKETYEWFLENIVK